MISLWFQHRCSGKSTRWARLITSHWADLETINFDIGSRLECLYLKLLLHWLAANDTDSPTAAIRLFTVCNCSPVQRWVIGLVSSERLLEGRAHGGVVGAANIYLLPEYGL